MTTLEAVRPRTEIIATLTKSAHGKLAEYLPAATVAAREDADFYAHLLAWNATRGNVRDARVALPVVALASRPSDRTYIENALALLAALPPREFAKAVAFAREVGAPDRTVRRLVARYLRDIEVGRWDRVSLQHRRALRGLYAKYHVKPSETAEAALFRGDPVGRFAVVQELRNMDPLGAAAAVVHHKIPFLVARGAVGKKMSNPDVLIALVERMTPAEVVTHAKTIRKMGKDAPALRAVLDAALGRVGRSKDASTVLKATQAAEAVEAEHPVLAAKLKAAQESQAQTLKTIDGDWLVLGDKSGSMTAAIAVASKVAALLTHAVKGAVHLVLFDVHPNYFDATGKTFDELTTMTRKVAAGGGTDLSCGLRMMRDRRITVGGIAIVSDGADHHTYGFPRALNEYAETIGAVPSVYFYRMPGEPDVFEGQMRRSGQDPIVFDVGLDADHYSLPALVQTMRTNRWSLVDEILQTPLVTLDDVLTYTKGTEVLPRG